MPRIEVGQPSLGRVRADAVRRAWSHIRRSRPTRLLLIGGGLVLCLGAGAAFYLTSEARERTVRSTLQEVSTLATVLSEETSRSFQGVHLVVKSVAESLSAISFSSEQDFREKVSTDDFYRQLKEKTYGVPQLGSITVVDRKGDVQVLTWSHPAPVINVSERSYFKHFQENPNDDSPFLSEPIQNKVTGAWTLLVVRPVRAADQAILGLVLGTIDLRYFRGLYESLELPKGSSIALWRTDGQLLIRHPEIPQVGKTLTSTLLPRLASSPGGVAYEGARSLDSNEQDTRLLAAKNVRDYPLAVAVSRLTRESMSDWQRQANITWFTAVLAGLAIVMVIFALARQFAIYERLNLAIEDQHRSVLEREDLERKLRQTQKLEMIGQLTAGIAHDFNNLLTVIGGNLDLLNFRVSKMQAPDPVRKNLDAAKEASGKAAALTNRLLAFSRKQPLAPQSLRVNNLIGGMIEMARRSLGEDVMIETSFGRQAWPVFVDRNQLESALLNLFLNSRDAMPGGGMLTIKTANHERDGENVPDAIEGDCVSISVSDTGTGMDASTREKAFEPFFTTKETGKGSGLGLSQLYGFIKQSGGEVTLESAPGAGTTVTIYLPRSRRLEPGESAPGEIAARGHGEVILLVDDNADVRDYGVEALRELGYRVLEADSADDALGLLQHNQVDLLLTDIGLPGADGADLVAMAREKYPDLKVLYATGYSKGDDSMPLNMDPNDPVLRKPFTYSSASTTIRQILDAA